MKKCFLDLSQLYSILLHEPITLQGKYTVPKAESDFFPWKEIVRMKLNNRNF